MSIEITGDQKKAYSFFAFCNTCPDFDEESGDMRDGQLQLSGNGDNSLEKAKNLAEKHQQNWRDEHELIIDCV